MRIQRSICISEELGLPVLAIEALSIVLRDAEVPWSGLVEKLSPLFSAILDRREGL